MEELKKWSAEYGLDLQPQQLEQFAVYEALLLEWNGRMNLTAIREPRQIRLRHFLDALTCATVTGDLNGRTLIDVGTGAGFPGLPLKILFPSLQLTFVESVHKKADFLRAVVAELALPDVHVYAERVERLGQQPQHRARYDWAVARAVAELRILAEYLLPLCRIGGHMLAQKGDSARSEAEAAMKAIHILGGDSPRITRILLPERMTPHFLVSVEKIKSTPDKYPRRVGVPAKRPL